MTQRVRIGARPGRIVGPRRKMIWADMFVSGVALATGTVVAFDAMAGFNAAYGADLLGATVTRIRQTFTGRFSDGSWGVGQTARLGWLKGASTLDNVDMDPIASPYLDWMFNKSYDFSVVSISNPPDFWRYEVDLKAQRKMEELQETLHFVVRNNSVLETLDFNSHARILLKLP